MTKIKVIIQCRTSSTRLPGKAFLPIKSIPMVILCVKRAINQGIDAIVATSNSKCDDNLIALLIEHQIPYSRGPLTDVLKRFVVASDALDDSDVIVRLTADNVFPDGEFVNELVAYTVKNKFDYCTTDYLLNGLPYGLGAEAFTVGAIRKADKFAVSLYDREHVTPWLSRHANKGTYLYSTDLKIAHLRCTVDTLEDYQSLQQVFKSVDDPIGISWRNLCELLKVTSYKHTAIIKSIKNANNLPISEFTLGTVQLGLPYGITNNQGLMSEDEAADLIKTALNLGINTFDCARGYGCAEKRLGNNVVNNNIITTKLSPFIEENANQNELIQFVRASVYQSCYELHRQKLDVLMLHRIWQFKNPIIWNELLNLKSQGIISHLGVSVSSVDEAIVALQNDDIETIQLPFNILDWRWLNEEFQSLVQERKNITIFIRSAFLQGLIISHLELWPEKFKEIGQDVINNLTQCVNLLGRKNIKDLCISYARAQSWINSIVIGCLDKQQVEENAKLFEEPILSKEECELIQKRVPRLPETFLIQLYGDFMNPTMISQFDYQQVFSLKNKVALVTGAGGYLGSYMAFSLGQAGAHVILNGRNEDSLKRTQEILKQKKIESTLLCFDITNNDQVIEKINEIDKTFQHLDIIVNNAHAGRACQFEEATSEDFLRDYNVDVIATFNIIKASVPLLKKAVSAKGDASIINISSMYGMVSPDPSIYSNSKMNNPPHYGAAKAALIQLTKYMACHLACEKIRVNSITPGPFPHEETMNNHPEFKKRLTEKVPLGRIGNPCELQGPILFLASAASSFITGTNLPVDGGWTAW